MSAAIATTVVVGNLKVGSRTSSTGLAVARAVLAHAGALDGDDDGIRVVELAELGGKLFAWGDPDVTAAKQAVLDADLVIVASPVYKASFTGLTKAFLDQFGRDELAARATVPVMVGAAPIHHLAMEGQLRPVLVEIGASCPTRGVFVLEKQLDTLDEQLAEWLGVWGEALVACARAPRPSGHGS